MKKGTFIAGLGLSGSGKTTVLAELSNITRMRIFSEPEENEWPRAVQNIKKYPFTALTCFRSERIPQLYDAFELSEEGYDVIFDTYYDKVLYDYLGKPGMEWLLDPEDPYFETALMMTKSDWISLPRATCIVFFYVSYDDWIKLLNKRGRVIDKDPQFLKSYKTQQLILNAAKKICKEQDINLIIFKQSFSDPKTQAQKLYNLLVENGLIQVSHEVF